MTEVLKYLRKLINRTGFDVVRVATFHHDISQHLMNVIIAHEIDAISMSGQMKDNVLPTLGGMLKMDTQGFDRHVFDGGVGSIDQVTVLQSEIALIPIYDGMDDAFETLA